MNEKDFIGKTVKDISLGTQYCIIDFTDGSKLEVTYFQRGYLGSDCSLDYEVEPPKATDPTESA